MNRKHLFLIGLTLSWFTPGSFGWLPNASAQKDQVYTLSGSTLSGTVTTTTPLQITVDVQGNPRTVKVNDIRRVMFAEDPPELNLGRGRILAGKYESGLRELQKLDPATINRSIVRRDLQYFLAYAQGRLALTAGGSKSKASEAMLAFVRAAPETFHFFDAAELLGDLAVSQEDYASAVRYYGTIATKAPFPGYQMRALIAEARALAAQQMFVEAEKKFDQAIGIDTNTGESKRQKKLAQIGKAHAIAQSGSPQKGIAMIEQIITENDASDTELFGRAYNALGDCLLSTDQTKAALMAYLHVDVLFYSDPQIHAKALYHLSQLWADVGKSDRAVAARNLLDTRYPGSIWSQK